MTTWPVFFIFEPTVEPVVFLIPPANIGPEKVVFDIIFLLEYLNVVPRG
jgi:hypothetical protein